VYAVDGLSLPPASRLSLLLLNTTAVTV